MSAWREDLLDGVTVFRPSDTPPGLLVAFSGRASAPPGEPSPTAFLARRLARTLSLDGMPIVRANQVHGARAIALREAGEPGSVRDAGECDALATDRADVALVVQTADCVPIVLASHRAVAIAHAGWRGAAAGVARSAVAALEELGAPPAKVRAWLGPSIRSCCYEVGGEVAAQFAGEFVRASCGGRFFLDLPAVNAAQLATAGVPPENVSAHPACTRCGGERFASYRRDGVAAGRMIGMVLRR
jgi:YfiH family protein